MLRPTLEVADIFRAHGPTWREANRGHVSLGQLKVMSAIERCRTAALGGHVTRCENGACGHTVVSFNSCRDRHCPKCQGAAAAKWLADREAELLPVPYFHVVYTLPSQLRDIAYQNKRVIYDLLMKASAETTLAIAADPKRLGAKIGITAVLHTWGSAMTHHPHVHMIVPGGGLSEDRSRWIAASADFLVHVNVLASLFRGKMLAMLSDAHAAGQLTFFNSHAGLADKKTFKRFLAPLRHINWIVYCKPPFAGPKQVLRYLSRYTHRVAISNRRLVAADNGGVSFRWKDYRIEGPERWKTMTLTPAEFIRRFLIHLLPRGFHRIRHYGLFANGNRVANIAKARELLAVAPAMSTPEEKGEAAAATEPTAEPEQACVLPRPCPCCGGRMIIIEVFARGEMPRHRPSPKPAPIRIDTS
jgi:Putative transposase/Transposase zinc-binding domain